MKSGLLILLFVLCGLTACSQQRPPWADGATIRTIVPADAAPQDLSNLRARLLALHNREREQVGVPPFVWDEALARSASSYGPELARLGRLAHSPRQSRPGQGENLWMGTRGAYSIEEMVGSWANERTLFRAGTFPDVSRNGHWSDVAHYTQMIWRQSARLGCALHVSDRSDFLICRYTPPGNVDGQRIP